MPEKVASYSSQRFSALLDFQREVDLVCPSHLGNKSSSSSSSSSSMEEGFLRATKANHYRGRHGDTFWQDSWSESLSALLSSSFHRAAPSPSPSPPRSCAVEASRRSSASFSSTLTRSQGQFSPQKFIRNALKRAFARDDAPSSSVMVKRARFEDFGSTVEPMVCG